MVAKYIQACCQKTLKSEPSFFFETNDQEVYIMIAANFGI